MISIFVDTSAWCALYDKDDNNHTKALKTTSVLEKKQAKLYTSNLVFAEIVTLVRARIGHKEAVELGKWLLQERAAEIVDINREVQRKAWDIFMRYDDKSFSFVDCSSFALMEELNIDEAFAFDKHFEQYGFNNFCNLQD